MKSCDIDERKKINNTEEERNRYFDIEYHKIYSAIWTICSFRAFHKMYIYTFQVNLYIYALLCANQWHNQAQNSSLHQISINQQVAAKCPILSLIKGKKRTNGSHFAISSLNKIEEASIFMFNLRTLSNVFSLFLMASQP